MRSVTDTITGMTVETTGFAAIGAEMRARRVGAGLSAAQLAELVGVTQATITRWELWQRKPSVANIRAYLEALNVSPSEVEELLARSKDTGIYRSGLDGLSAQSRQRAELLESERTASRISVVSPMLIPGLLQTADYIRAMIGADPAVPREEIETRVAVRLGRKDALVRRSPVKLLAVLGESALSLRIGNSDTMADQLQSLLTNSMLPNIDIRVSPHHAGWTPAIDGLFVLVEFDDRAPVVRTENQKSSLIYRDPEDFKIFHRALNQVLETALDPESSRDLIAKYKEKWE